MPTALAGGAAVNTSTTACNNSQRDNFVGVQARQDIARGYQRAVPDRQVTAELSQVKIGVNYRFAPGAVVAKY